MLFPPRCPACRRVMEDAGIYIHPECRGKFRLIVPPRCFKCGRTVAETEDICAECRRKRHAYDWGLALFDYDDTARLAMVDYKGTGIRRNGEFFATEAAKRLGGLLKKFRPEVLVPVPISDRKLGERGFNQSEYITDRVSELLGIPMDAEVLFRKKSKVDQKKLSAKERLNNADFGFWTVEDMPYKRICLVDDVYTTGSTLDACTRVLKEAGAREVGFLVIFSGIPVVSEYNYILSS